MITARYESHLFPRDRSPSGRLGTSRRVFAPQSTENDDIDRFMELAHAALEEATKEEDAKGVLRELLERFLARTGAPLMADVIDEQLRSQEIIERLAEQSFERQRGRYEQQQQQQQFLPTSSVSTGQKTRLDNITSLTRNEKHRKYSSSQQRLQTTPLESIPSSPLQSSLPSSISASSSTTNQKDPHDSETIDEAVTRDHFIIQQSPSLHAGPDRLLLISEYIWRLFRLLILASLVALVYHYVCTHPYPLFLAI